MPSAAQDIRALDPASPDQRRELRELVQARAVDPFWRTRLYQQVRAAGQLTRSVALDALFYARACAPAGPLPDRATPEQAAALRDLINTRIVPGPLATVFRRRAESGELTYIEADRWIREWMRLTCKTFVIASDLPRRSGWQAPDGYYGLMHTDGHPRCYRIHTLGASNRQIVEQITGDGRGQRRKLVGYQATEVLQAVATDRAAAARLYGRTRRHCSACNQPIGDDTKPGFEHGYGPDCWTELQASEETSCPPGTSTPSSPNSPSGAASSG